MNLLWASSVLLIVGLFGDHLGYLRLIGAVGIVWAIFVEGV